MKLIKTLTLIISAVSVLSGCSILSSKSDVDDQLIPKTEVVVPGIRVPLEEGDTLWEFAERTTGSGFNWEKLKMVNKIEDENNIDAGTVLLVPDELALDYLKNR